MKQKIFMKYFTLIVLPCLIGTILSAQTVTDPSKLDPAYDTKKLSLIQKSKPKNNRVQNSATASLALSACNVDNNCFIPIDASYTPVPRNDDGSFGPIALPFTFDLYGSSYSEVWINTNGNLTFTDAFDQYAPDGFPVSIPMVAAFWGDIDTRGTGSGQIYYQLSGTHLIVTWNGVGYYNQHADKLNTFQIIIGEPGDALLGPGNNVRFSYKDMQWAIADGTAEVRPTTVGVNKGDDVSYIQVGRFDQENCDYDGPGNQTDGIDYLEFQCFPFNVSTNQNIPPGASGFPSNDSITINTGDTVSLSPQFIGPEVGQTVTAQVNTGNLCKVTYSTSNGQVSEVDMKIIGDACNVGTHTITFTATDNGTPVRSTTVSLTVIVKEVCNLTATVSPQGTVNVCKGDSVLLTANSGAGISFQWLKNGNPVTGATNQTLMVKDSGNYRIAESKTATCKDTSAITKVNIINPPAATITPQGNLNICQSRSVVLKANSGTGFTYKWKKNNIDITGATNNQYTATAAATYTVTVTNTNGCSKTSAGAKVIDSCGDVCSLDAQIAPAGNVSICKGNAVLLTANSGSGITYKWLKNGTLVAGAASRTLNVRDAGNYQVIESNATCKDTSAITKVIVVNLPGATITPLGNLNICQTHSVVLQANAGTNFKYQWLKNGDSIPNAKNRNYTATTRGVYRVRVTNSGGCSKTSPTITVDSCSNCLDIVWQKSLGGSAQEGAYCIQQTTDGGYITAGFSTSADITGNRGGQDVWVVKLNANGTIRWQKSYGSSANDAATYIEQTVDKGYVICGKANESGGSFSDYLVLKIDSLGNVQWQKTFGGSGNDVASNVHQTSDYGYIVLGGSESNDGIVTGNHGAADYWILKLDSTGNITWQKSYGGSAQDGPWSIKQTADGGYIASGSTNSSDGDVTGYHGGTDVWVVKLKPNGDIDWQKCFGGSGMEDCHSLNQTGDGGFIISAGTASNNGDVSGNHGGTDIWAVKLNSLGNIEWQKCLGGSGNEFPFYSVDVTMDGGYLIEGNATSSDGDLTSNHGGFDYWIVKLNPAGNIQWQKNLGGSSDDVPAYCKETNDGNVIVAGSSSSNDGDVSGNHGSSDAWIVKFGCNGAQSTVSASSSSISNPKIDVTTDKVLLYPNPSKGNITITNNSSIAGSAVIKVYDMLGRIVFNTREQAIKGNNTYHYNLSNLSPGIYYLELSTNETKNRTKFVIER